MWKRGGLRMLREIVCDKFRKNRFTVMAEVAFFMNFKKSSCNIISQLWHHRTDNYFVDIFCLNSMSLIHHHKLHLHLVAGSVRLGIENPGDVAVVIIK